MFGVVDRWPSSIDSVITRSHDPVYSPSSPPILTRTMASSTTEPTSHTTGFRKFNHCRCLDPVVRCILNIPTQLTCILPGLVGRATGMLVPPNLPIGSHPTCRLSILYY